MMNDHTKNSDEDLYNNEHSNSDEIKEIDALASEEETNSSQETEQVQEEPKESPGVILKRERQAQGLSLEIVHEATKVPLDALRAIEEGYKIRMLSPFYYKGFVKLYADYLGIDASEVIEDYKQEQLPEHIEEDIDGFEVPEWITKFFTKERKQQIIIAAAGIIGLFLLVKMISLIGHRKPIPRAQVKKETPKIKIVKKETVKEEVVKKETEKIIEKVLPKPIKKVPIKTVKRVIPKTEPKKVPPVVVKPPKPAPEPPPVQSIQKDINLTVRAKQNSWLRVKADSVVVFQSTLRVGAVETWVADDEIEISGKNINELEFELNGKMIGTLGRKDRNAKKVVITKNGLSVKN